MTRPRPALSAALACSLVSPALAELALDSRAFGLDLVALDALPAVPGDKGEAEFCTHLFVGSPETDGGREAAAKGWFVTRELAFGDLTAVSFVGQAIPATSGTCDLLDGNVGFFSGDQLVALLYGTQPGELMIGSIRPFGDGGLRILSGDTLPGPVADLKRDSAGGILATELAKEEPVCNGAGLVPDIDGLPIDDARARLIRAGWKPIPGDPAQQSHSQAEDIAAAGVPEVEDCSGTGFAFCAYGYSGPEGTLRVITAGEVGESGGLPMVSSYGVDCQ